MLKNLSFEEVDHVPLLTALKREAQFPGWLPQDVAGDDRYRGLQSLCNDIIQSATGTGHPLSTGASLPRKVTGLTQLRWGLAKSA